MFAVRVFFFNLANKIVTKIREREVLTAVHGHDKHHAVWLKDTNISEESAG